MQQDREIIYRLLTKVFYNCQIHPDEIANMIINNQQTEVRTIICSSCLALMPSQIKEVKPFKMALLQIHNTCKKLMTDVTLAAFVDHHLNLIRGIARNHFKQIEPVLQSSVTNWFAKYRQLINGKYFNEFYAVGSQILSVISKSNIFSENHIEKSKRLKRMMNFIDAFYKKVSAFQVNQKMTLDQVISGQNMIKKIKAEVGDIYKQFKEKSQASKTYGQEQVLELFNPSIQTAKSYRFSPTLIHSSLKILDSKTVTMPNLPDNQQSLLSLIQPSIGNKKRQIKLKMNGIKGWVAVGIAIKSKVQANSYKFQSINHGTFQISYDAYSWGEDSTVNEQYTSWYFNQNDILTLTVNPMVGEIVFVKNYEQNKAYTVKFKHQKKDKLYFCASLNYHQDSVSIVE